MIYRSTSDGLSYIDEDPDISRSIAFSQPPGCAPAAPSANELLGFPAGLVMLERATAALRVLLRARGLGGYAIFYTSELDLSDLDVQLPRLEPGAAWEPLPLLPGGDQPQILDIENDAPRANGVGVLHLPAHRFVIARWNWLNERFGCRETTVLVAAPDQQAYADVYKAIVEHRRGVEYPMWDIIRDFKDIQRKRRRPMSWDDLFLSADVVHRIRSEVVNFFTPAAAELYARLKVPYRRGVLMHGPPGNGKTSIIKAIGASMPAVHAMILRPSEPLGDGALGSIFRRWRDHAPAILVIEDLDHLLKQYINLSHFLNQIDGIDGGAANGLLLLATTNHPEKLDPAINNRPGRFDVVIEIPDPEDALRARFLAQHLPDIDPAVLDELVRETARLSFAHLHELIRLAGLLAINQQAAVRTPDNLRNAARIVAKRYQDACDGFARPPEAPFGLQQFRRKRPKNLK